MRLYALLDEASLQRHGWSVERFVERAVSLGAELIQYRNKEGDNELFERRVAELARLFRGRVIVNDRPEFATLCGGLHVGQEDLRRFGKSGAEAIRTLRRIVGEDRWIGLSTHDEAEILAANELPIDYIGLGACRATRTKSDAGVLGVAEVSRLAALSRHPVAAIGGVRLDDEIPNVAYRVVGSALYED
ncbi:thiamine phosphate synthase [Hydrogenimonas sp.]